MIRAVLFLLVVGVWGCFFVGSGLLAVDLVSGGTLSSGRGGTSSSKRSRAVWWAIAGFSALAVAYLATWVWAWTSGTDPVTAGAMVVVAPAATFLLLVLALVVRRWL